MVQGMTTMLNLKAEIAILKEQLSQSQAQVEQLERQIAWFKKQLFGSKSERVDLDQLLLEFEGLKEQAPKPKPPKQKVEYEREVPSVKGTQPTRDERYSHLPVSETVVIEPESVKQDPESFERIGEEETFEIDVHPPKFIKRRILRPKYRRKADRSAAPVVAPAPCRIIEGIPALGLLVYLILSKYCDHLPLFRIAKMAHREGVNLSRQSLMRWVEEVADWLKPIYAYIGRELLEGGYIQADETPIKYLDPDENNGISRSEEAISAFLSDYKGILQTDAYAGWLSFTKDKEHIIQVGCMAHVRRKFYEALDESPRYGGLIIRLMGQLYAYEQQYRDEGFSPKLVAVTRQGQSRMVFEHIHRVIRHVSSKVLPQSGIGKACSYALNQWKDLEKYLEYGQVQIDNNLVENAIRPSAIGKKNWLFVGHPKAGDRPAVIYSLLISCERFGHNPREYLTDVLRRLTLERDRFNPRCIAELTPSRWKAPTKPVIDVDVTAVTGV